MRPILENAPDKAHFYQVCCHHLSVWRMAAAVTPLLYLNVCIEVGERSEEHSRRCGSSSSSLQGRCHQKAYLHFRSGTFTEIGLIL